MRVYMEYPLKGHNGELIKRLALESINYWNEETIVDDLDMSTRLHIKGWDIRFCPDIKVYEGKIAIDLPVPTDLKAGYNKVADVYNKNEYTRIERAGNHPPQ